MALSGWLVVGFLLLILVIVGFYSRRFVNSTADWLVAGRGCGKYLGATAGEAAGLGAVSIIAYLQAAYIGGPVAWWFLMVTIVAYLLISVTGWGVYRLRETRVMTINELLERRYSRKFRIFCGMLCFTSGVLNMSIFPIVTGRFIVYFSGLPTTFSCCGFGIATIPVVTAVLVIISVGLVFMGGQVSLIFTDFIQWIIMMCMFILVGIAVYRIVNWDHIAQTLLTEEKPEVMLDPFLPTSANEFGLWYCIMFTLRAFYNILSWAPGTIKSQSATGAREAKMMWILSYIRQGANIGLLFTAVACLAFMKLPIFAEGAAKVTAALEQINNVKIQSEMAVPIFLAFTLPMGIKALFLAGMISAAISTLDTYFLTWAGVFTQDIVSPLRSRDFTVAQRLKFLKWSVVGIATFVFIFSVLWKPTQYIWMYFAITGSIYTGGAGAVILGALYWKGGTKQGAWSAMIIGSSLSVSSIVILQMFSKQLWWPSWINGMLLSILASACAVVTFIIVSVFTGHEKYDIKRLLNRLSICDSESKQGKYIRKKPVFETIVGVIAVLLATGMIGGFLYSRTHEISSESWVTFWKWYSFILFGYSLPITVWFLIGGFVDVKILIQKLRSKKGDLKDDGQIHSNSA